MTLTREDPRPLRAQLMPAAFGTVGYSAMTVLAGWALTRYGPTLADYAADLGAEPSDVATWRLPITLALIALPAWWAVASGVELVRLIRRFRTARRWERQLDDPRQAAEVPPLEGHLIVAKRTGVGGAALWLVISVLATIVLTVVGLRASGPILGQDPETLWLVAAGSALIAAASWCALRIARRRARVERLSSSGPAEPAPPDRGPVAGRVPTLQVQFTGPLRPEPSTGAAPRILYLRLFDNLDGTTRFVHRWRRFGHVHYLRSSDQVSSAELARSRDSAGNLSMFIDNDAELDEFLARRWPADQRGGYPARALLCHGSFWKRAVTRLLLEVDVIFLDLTGFHAAHLGTGFELQAAFDLVEVRRLRLLAAFDSDQRFLAAQLQRAWAAMASGSPNAGAGSRTIVVHLG